MFIAGSTRIHEGSPPIIWNDYMVTAATATTVIKRNNPPHDHDGIVLGNGPSRRGLDLHKLAESATIYGCNALYRDFQPDFLFANDVNMMIEILQSNYPGRCVFLDTPPLPKEQAEACCFMDSITGKEVPITHEFGIKEQAEEFIYIPHHNNNTAADRYGKVFIWLSPNLCDHIEFNYQTHLQWGAGTGLGALQYALENGGHKRITVYGFDSLSSTAGSSSWDNVYDGTPVYSTDSRRLECKKKNIPYVPLQGDTPWNEVVSNLKALYPNVEVEVVEMA